MKVMPIVEYDKDMTQNCMGNDAKIITRCTATLKERIVMTWEEVKKVYPNQWVIIEAIDAHTEGDKRIINQITVVDQFDDDNNKALLRYLQLHRKHRERELYVVHTSRSELDIIEQNMIGVRAGI